MIYRESPGRAHAGRVLAERSLAFASEPTPDQIECYYPDFCRVNRLMGGSGVTFGAGRLVLGAPIEPRSRRPRRYPRGALARI
jgi:hypothetical protein